MSTTAVNWLTCYQQLTKLSALLQETELSNILPQVFRHANELNLQLHQLCEQSPAAAIAQLSIAPVDVPLLVKQAIKSWVLLAIWARLKHWPPVRRDAICIAALLACSLPSRDNIPAALRLANTLKKLQTGGLTTTLLAGTWHTLQHKLPWQVHRDSPLLTLAIQLGQQLQPADNKMALLADLMATHWLAGKDEQALLELDQLAQLAPYLHVLGRQVTDATGRTWLICQWQGTECQALLYRAEQQQCGTEIHTLPTEGLQWLPAQPMLPQHWLDRLSMPALPLTLIPTPKWLVEHSIVAKILAQDLDAQVRILEHEPLICQYILDNASSSNRRQTIVSRLRHALAIFGQNQLPDAVAQAEVLQYLQRQANSQHQVLLQLQQVFRHSLFLLGESLAQPFNAQQAGLIAACCSAPLWHHPSIQAVPLSRTTAQGWLLAELTQHYLLEPVKSQRLSAALLHHYQHAIWAEAVLLQYQPPGQSTPPLRHSYGLLMRLAWQLTFSIFNYPKLQSTSTTLCQQLAQVLHLPEPTLSAWQMRLVEYANPYCPLD